MPDAAAVVQRYFRDFWAGETEGARRYLADDLAFAGPAASIRGADAYLRATEHARAGARGIERRQVFANGDDVCVWYDLLLRGPVDSTSVAEWYHVDGDRITANTILVDTAPFTQPREAAASSSTTAVDPVCHMTVEKAAPAATRVYRGTTYYFCNPGCAVAFDQEPERYLAAPA